MRKLLAATMLLALGSVTLGASADHQDPLHEHTVGTTTVGVEFTQGRTCIYVQDTANFGHAAVAVGANPEYRTGSGEYDKHGDKTPQNSGDDSLCQTR